MSSLLYGFEISIKNIAGTGKQWLKQYTDGGIAAGRPSPCQVSLAAQSLSEATLQLVSTASPAPALKPPRIGATPGCRGLMEAECVTCNMYCVL